MDLPAKEAEWQSMLRLSSRHLVTPLLAGRSRVRAGVPEFRDAVYILILDYSLRYQDQLGGGSIGARPRLGSM